MGDVESGVRETFAELGIKEPRTAPEKLALYLANALDSCQDDKVKAGLSRELRLTLDDVRNQPRSSTDAIGTLLDRRAL